MPGIATHFKILELTISQLEASGEVELQAIAAVMKNNAPYAYLGAIGPAIADFIPSDPPPEGIGAIGYGNAFKDIWKGAFQIVGGDGTDTNPGLLKILQTFQDFFNQIQPILDNEDLFALSDMKDSGAIDKITTMAAALSNAVTNLTAPNGYISNIEGYIGQGMMPAVDLMQGSPIAIPDAWSPREYLYWRKPGQFTKQLLEDAIASNDDRFLAYAYGYISSYASNVCGSSFINSIIGGTYRSDWWRYRWINNFIDAWVYGYYEAGATMAGDTPTPGYDSWKSLCNAQLHQKIELPGIDPIDLLLTINNAQAFPQVLPIEFDTYWYGAFEKVYGPRSMVSRFKPNSLNGAYLMTWMMLWFQTSGKVVGCNPPPPMTPPEGAENAPSWADPSVPGDNGTGSVPPEPSVEDDVDEGKIITGVLLALLGLATIAGGGLLIGAFEIKTGVEMVITGANEINWQKLRGDVYWYRMYLYNGLKALHEVMVLGALQHPYASVLQSGDSITLLGFPFTFDSAKKNCKSKSDKQFPVIPWDGKVGLTGLWISEPSRATEQPATIPYLSGGKYPSFFIDENVNNPLTNSSDLKNSDPLLNNTDGGQFRYKLSQNGAQVPVQFGNAVGNTLDLYRIRKFPDWNLDSDRGLAYLTWKFKNVYSNPVDIAPE